MALLLKQAGVRDRWSEEDAWSRAAELAVHAHYAHDQAKELIERGLQELLSAEPVVVAHLVANVAWEGQPLYLDGAVVGTLDDDWIALVNAEAAGRPSIDRDAIAGWWKDQAMDNSSSVSVATPPSPPVAIASWTDGQSSRAVVESEQWFTALVDLQLLLEPEPEELGLYRGRGSTNRPGLRGLQLDRRAVEWFLAQSDDGADELGTETLVVGRHGQERHHGWFSADPFPLAILLRVPGRLELVNRYLSRSSPVARRLRIAAQWVAEAHWALEPRYAILALGVAMDAIVGSVSGLPGRVMAQRFAFLEADPGARAERAKRYNAIFSARSAVAHGGEPRELLSDYYDREVAREVRWAANRLIDLDLQFGPGSEREVEELFESLTWGTGTSS